MLGIWLKMSGDGDPIVLKDPAKQMWMSVSGDAYVY